MSYYMRFFIEGDRVPSDEDLVELFDEAGAGFKLSDGVLFRDAEDFAVIEVNRRGEELFDDEIREFRESLAEVPDGPGKARVARCLDAAGAVVAVQVLFGGRDADETLEALDPLWDTLFADYGGLMQADAEGFYDADDQVLELD
ncbi:MAG: hypothetical protein ACOZDY_05105 [Pseudomonadota bacterium]